MKHSAIRAAALKAGWRSGLEEKLGRDLEAQRIRYAYEALTISYTPPAKVRKYTPDFLLLASGIILESKGRFVTADRQKHLAVKAQHPDLDLRFVFSNARQRISKQSQTTYAMWCEAKGFRYSDKGVVPQAWLTEPPNHKSLAAIAAIMEGM